MWPAGPLLSKIEKLEHQVKTTIHPRSSGKLVGVGPTKQGSTIPRKEDKNVVSVYSVGIFDGLYVNSYIFSIKVSSLIDMGSSRTLLSATIFKKIPLEERSHELTHRSYS